MYYTKLTAPEVGVRKAGIYMQMNIRFELKPKQRPKLVEEIASALHTIPCYQKAPSLSYKIGDCTLEKDGTLRIPDNVDTETVNRLLTHLEEKGFTAEMEQTEEKLIIFMPKDSFTDTALENLKKLIENSGLFLYAHTNESEAYFLKEIKKIKEMKDIKDMAERNSEPLMASRVPLVTMRKIFSETDKKIIQCIKNSRLQIIKRKRGKKKRNADFFPSYPQM